MREVDRILLELYIDIREAWGECEFTDTGACYKHMNNVTNPDRCPLMLAQIHLDSMGYLENPQIISNPEIGT